MAELTFTSRYGARNIIETERCKRKLEEHERSVLGRFMGAMEIDTLVLMPNYRFDYVSLLAPSGYVATLNMMSTFRPDAFIGKQELFRSFACVQVQLERPLTDEARRLAERRLNLFVRDRSPLPLRVGKGKPRAAWVPSLGKAGWGGLFKGTRHIAEHSKTPISAKKPYYLCVVAGLDKVTYDDMDLLMHQKSGACTYWDMFAPDTGSLDVFRRAAVENRARLLALMAKCFGVTPVDCNVVTRGDETYELGGHEERGSLAWLALGKCEIPAWFTVPAGHVRGMPAPPAELVGACPSCLLANPLDVMRHPVALSPARETLCNDVVPYTDTMLAAYMGCASTKSAFGVPHLACPGEDFIVYNFYGGTWEDARCFNAFAHEAAHEHDAEEPAHVDLVTWESAALERNRNLCGRWVGADESAYTDVGRREDYVSMEPMFVRVSAYDARGLALEPPQGKNAFKHLAVELQYTPI